VTRLHVSEAWEQALEDRALTCKTCDAPSEEGGTHCMPCRTYWEDVLAGVFDEPDVDGEMVPRYRPTMPETEGEAA